MSARCGVIATWSEIPPHGVRLECHLPAGHDGDHACAELEYISAEEASR